VSDVEDLSGHVVLCGLGKVALSALEILSDLGVAVVVIAREVPAEWAARVERWSARVILDDDRDETALEAAHAASARAVVIATDDDLANLETALDVLELAPGVPIVLRIYDLDLSERVRMSLPVRAVLNAGNVAAGAFVAAALGESVLGTYTVDNATVDIAEVAVTADDLAQAPTAGSFVERLNAVAIGVRGAFPPPQGASWEDVRLSPGDVVVAATARCSGGDDSTSCRRRRSRQKARRVWRRPRSTPFRVAAGLWRQATWPLRVAALGFVAFLAMAIVVYRVSLGLSWLDAVYFTITVVTTVGFGDIVLLGAPPAVKVFGMFTMLAGVALLVVGFGILTDYLVSHRVEQAVGRPRTTLKDHVVVVGLGNIGHRVALDLYAVGHTVLAIDQRSDLRFTSLLPADIPVMFGDATDPQTLRRAGAGDARAIVAVTDNDVANLRVAHEAKGMNPAVRTVIRLFSHRLADRLGTRTLGVDLALNPSAAAGATFAAAALEDGVLQGIWYGGRLLMLRRVPCRGLGVHGRSVASVRSLGLAMPLLRRAYSTSHARGRAQGRGRPDRPRGVPGRRSGLP